MLQHCNDELLLKSVYRFGPKPKGPPYDATLSASCVCCTEKWFSTPSDLSTTSTSLLITRMASWLSRCYMQQLTTSARP